METTKALFFELMYDFHSAHWNGIVTRAAMASSYIEPKLFMPRMSPALAAFSNHWRLVVILGDALAVSV